MVRVLAHTQIKKIGFGQKKAHIFEIQVRIPERGGRLTGGFWALSRGDGTPCSPIVLTLLAFGEGKWRALVAHLKWLR